jgi:Mg/Co/Ni transporter MgtE
MKIFKTFESYMNSKVQEDALKAGEESDVYVDDVTLDSGSEIKAAEILGAINAKPTEKEFKQYFYNEYGEGAFAEGEIDQLVKMFNDFQAEKAEKEKEAEKEAEKGGGEGGEEDPLAGLGV